MAKPTTNKQSFLLCPFCALVVIVVIFVGAANADVSSRLVVGCLLLVVGCLQLLVVLLFCCLPFDFCLFVCSFVSFHVCLFVGLFIFLSFLCSWWFCPGFIFNPVIVCNHYRLDSINHAPQFVAKRLFFQNGSPQ